MAEAKKTTVKVSKTVEVDESRVELVLSNDEAHALADVVARVGGSPDTSRRGLIEKIYDALRDAGYSYENSPKASRSEGFSKVDDLKGSLHFN